MDKIIFKGTVNGQEYNNVRDYNEAVKEALKHGPVNASSKTYTKTDTDTYSKPIDQQETEQKEEFATAPTPGIHIEYDEDGNVAKVNQLYLNEISNRLKANPNIDPNLYLNALNEELREELRHNCVPYIKRAEKNTDFPNQLEGYLDDIEHIQAILRTTVDQIEEKTATLNQKINVLNTKAVIVDNMLQFYDELAIAIGERLAKQSKDTACDELTCKCNNPTAEYTELRGTAKDTNLNDLRKNLIEIGTMFAKAIIDSIDDLKK